VSRGDPRTDVLVAGAGPAGVAVALGLARLGYDVTVLGLPRGFAACEGISPRVRAHLATLGLHNALACVPEASLREVEWNGERRAQGSEHLLQRAPFDAALGADLVAAGVRLRAARVRGIVLTAGGGAEVLAEDGSRIRARFVVDARGRAAPRGRGRARRGPETVALLQRWQGPPAPPASAVFAFAGGWAWLARLADGSRYTQFTLAAGTRALGKRSALEAQLRARVAALPRAEEWVRDCRPLGAPQARGATSLLHTPLWDLRGLLRVGDAAMAVDPLSGNGIFQSLSSASVAPAVINTWLGEPDGADLARDFYARRIEHVFLRFARTGRDFYRAETRWAGADFWRLRGAWPDALPAHDPQSRVTGLAMRAVVEDGFVREREVVLTSDQPLGVWRVEGVELAPLLRALPEGDAGAELARRIAHRANGEQRRARALQAWCRGHGLAVPAEPAGD
jgi:flavin-dependent dehydrogenase